MHRRRCHFPRFPRCLINGIGKGCEIERLGPYLIEAECGRGGMSVVYSAVHVSLKTRHAVKVFDVGDCSNAAVLRGKFLAEARILATLRHPNIVRVTDYGTTDDGRPWLAMDFIGGTTLAARLARPDPPTSEESLSLYRDIRSALSHCHAHGIVHGDLKAENVLLCEDGRAVLSDFGISRILDTKMRMDLELTGSCEAGGFGTVYALAPECRDGSPATPSSDVYSFGVLMFKVVTGIWYEGSPRLLEQLRTLAPQWEHVLSRMLEMDPLRRPETAAELAAEPTRVRCRSPFGKAALLAASLAASCLVGSVVVGMGFSPSHRLLLSGDDVSLHAGRASMRDAVRIGHLRLPVADGLAEIAIPNDFEGVLLTAGEVDGVLNEQVRILPQQGMRVLYRGNREIVIKRQ